MSEKINKSASDSLGDVVITMYKVENLDSTASYTTTGQKLGISTAPKPRDSTIVNDVHISNIDSFMIAKSRKLSRESKSKFMPGCGIYRRGIFSSARP